MAEDSPLLAHLKEKSFSAEKVTKLVARGIETYDHLFNLIRDESADVELRKIACDAVWILSDVIDKRRADPSLLTALNASDLSLRMSVIWILGMMRSRRATLPLIQIAANSHEPEDIRKEAVYSLTSIRDPRALPLYIQLVHDKTAPVELRSYAIEGSAGFRDHDWIRDYIQLLSDESSDVRFWTAFGFVQISNTRDYSVALEKLDEIVAYDHILPVYWGWHVDREAILPLEQFYYRPYTRFEDGFYFTEGTYLISPAPEYDTFIQQYRQRSETSEYLQKPVPIVDLQLEPDWLKTELESAWQEITFNHRQSKAYLLDWTLEIDGKPIIGALHRDRYAVVLTGDHPLVQRFANWYRSVIAPEHPLYLYEWAGDGEALPVEIEDNS